MVRMRGLEPPRLAALDPKSSVYANFTTSAQILTIIKVVSPSGFEPETYALEGRCSIQLSYGPEIKMVRSERVELPTY